MYSNTCTVLVLNAASSHSSSSFFPSCHPLFLVLLPPNKVGINFDMRWDLALPLPKDPFCVRPEFSDEITVVRIFPGPFSTLKTLLQPPLRGLVMQTFGAGNAPDADPVFLGLLKEACDRGVVIINITQCAQGTSTRLVV